MSMGISSNHTEPFSSDPCETRSHCSIILQTGVPPRKVGVQIVNFIDAAHGAGLEGEDEHYRYQIFVRLFPDLRNYTILSLA